MAIEILLKIIDCKKQPKLLLTGGEGGGITPAGFGITEIEDGSRTE
jgi:hypothetical protein